MNCIISCSWKATSGRSSRGQPGTFEQVSVSLISINELINCILVAAGQQPTDAAAAATAAAAVPQGSQDPNDPGSFEPLSLLQFMRQQLQAEFGHLGGDGDDGDDGDRLDTGRNLRTPSSFDSLDQPSRPRPLTLRPGYSRLDLLGGLRFDDDFITLQDDGDEFGDDDDVEIFKY